MVCMHREFEHTRPLRRRSGSDQTAGSATGGQNKRMTTLKHRIVEREKSPVDARWFPEMRLDSKRGEGPENGCDKGALGRFGRHPCLISTQGAWRQIIDWGGAPLHTAPSDRAAAPDEQLSAPSCGRPCERAEGTAPQIRFVSFHDFGPQMAVDTTGDRYLLTCRAYSATLTLLRPLFLANDPHEGPGPAGRRRTGASTGERDRLALDDREVPFWTALEAPPPPELIAAPLIASSTA